MRMKECWGGKGTKDKCIRGKEEDSSRKKRGVKWKKRRKDRETKMTRDKNEVGKDGNKGQKEVKTDEKMWEGRKRERNCEKIDGIRREEVNRGSNKKGKKED